MPNLGGRGHGDLFVAVTLVTPKTLTKEQRELLEQLAEIEDADFSDESFMDKVRIYSDSSRIDELRMDT